MAVDAAEGITTGISAADRSIAIKLLADENAGPETLVQPGHVFPLKAKNGGVLVRGGQTEGSVDLARLCGARPAAAPAASTQRGQVRPSCPSSITIFKQRYVTYYSKTPETHIGCLIN